uniref:Precorrin-8X methylmutase n=1 Tax=Fundidesulfovibrio putealis TaxID=270496 RepID=A0A7C4AIB1_9BACT
MITTAATGPHLPEDIERTSFAIIDQEMPKPLPFQGPKWEIARRLVHTSADFELPGLLRFTPRAVEAGIGALRAGAIVVTDTRMCQAGIPLRRLTPLGASTVCFMDDPQVASQARQQGHTRARLAVERALELPGPVIFAVGNAPTALLRLLELLEHGAQRPELIVGMPVGFVNAAESKAALLARPELESIVIEGRKGGSALAAACVNALAEMALRAAP